MRSIVTTSRFVGLPSFGRLVFCSSLRSFSRSKSFLGGKSDAENGVDVLDAFERRTADNAVNLEVFQGNLVRNFGIISHVDHGKTTLSTRLLQETGSISQGVMESHEESLYLDKLQVERERGITVHASASSILWNGHLLNLVDTPGHVDFSYEVSRALAACEGALLLVDATKGIQAQTLSNFWLAFSEELTIVPILNKVDLQTARVDDCLEQMKSHFGIEPKEVIQISAKTGLNVTSVLDAVVDRIPSPAGNRDDPLQAMLFDSWYDRHVGVIMLWKVVNGVVKPGDKIYSSYNQREYQVQEVGVMHPEPTKATALHAGQVGYVVSAMRTAPEAVAGDTWHHKDIPVEALGGFKPPLPVVWAGLFSCSQDDSALLSEAMEKILLTDNSVVARKESSLALGTGFRCGFLGVLHMDVFMQRLAQEHNVEVVATAPTVPYRVTMKNAKENVIICDNPSEFPDPGTYSTVEEPMVKATIVLPSEFMGPVMQLCISRRAENGEMENLGDSSVVLTYEMPLAETITGFFDKLKEMTSGFASFEYEHHGYRETDLVKVDVLLNGTPAPPLASLTHRSHSREWGLKITSRLKKVIHRQMFEVIIQAAIGSKILCRERIAALRKNVTAKCYGGDMTRKRKLLDKQKRGKKRMRSIGNVELGQEAFFSVLNKD